MTHAIGVLKVAACLAVLSALPVCAQISNEEATSDSSAAPVAYVYLQASGVDVYSVSAAGKLTLVKGSPFNVTGAMEDVNGKYLISVGNTWLHSYPIESSGAPGKQVSAINTEEYGGSQCGETNNTGSVLDHTGKYLYVSLFLPANDVNTGCGVWQTYQVEPDGHFKYLGYVESAGSVQGNAEPDGVPTISSSDKFAYATQPQFEDGGYNAFTGFKIASSGELEGLSSFESATPQTPDGNWFYFPSSIATDNAGHLAALLNWFGDGDATQLASYTIESNGNIKSANTWKDMPSVSPSANGISMSWSGKLLAVNQNPGLQMYHFNGAAPITKYSPVMLPTVYINQMAWDANNHLYVLAGDPLGLYVYTVTPTSLSEVAGSPFTVPSGSENMIVVPK